MYPPVGFLIGIKQVWMISLDGKVFLDAVVFDAYRESSAQNPKKKNILGRGTKDSTIE